MRGAANIWKRIWLIVNLALKLWVHTSDSIKDYFLFYFCFLALHLDDVDDIFILEDVWMNLGKGFWDLKIG